MIQIDQTQLKNILEENLNREATPDEVINANSDVLLVLEIIYKELKDLKKQLKSKEII